MDQISTIFIKFKEIMLETQLDKRSKQIVLLRINWI